MTMLKSVRTRLGSVFVGFLLLVVGSAWATFVGIQTQAADEATINLAGRQRMLTQAVVKAALGLEGERAADYQLELRQAADLFDTTLSALLDGGSIPHSHGMVTVRATSDPAVRAQLQVVGELWNTFQSHVEAALAAPAASPARTQAIRELEALSPAILQEMDRAVGLYEARAHGKLEQLRTIQLLFLISALGLVGAGYMLTQRTVVGPLTALEGAAQRIADGDLDSSIRLPAAAEEVSTLAGALEDMRRRLASSRQELERWTAELGARVRDRTAQLEALFEVSAEISSQLEIDHVLERVTEKTRELADAEVAVLCLIDPSTGACEATAVSGLEEAVSPLRPTIAREPVLDQAPAAAEMALNHSGSDCHLLHPSFRSSHLAVPLRVADRVLGALCVGHRAEAHFGEEQAQLLTLLASVGAIALENARSYEGAEQEATLAERERILAEIHDGLAQTLSFMHLRLDVIQNLIDDKGLDEVSKHLALMQRTVEQSSQEVRRLMAGLYDRSIAQRPFEELLHEAVVSFSTTHDMQIEWQMCTSELPPQTRGTYDQVVRIALEALANVYKHAGGRQAWVTLDREGGQVVLRVQDHGRGFDADEPATRPGHFGLKVMQARAERIGGQLQIESGPGQGTVVTLCWPTNGERESR